MGSLRTIVSRFHRGGAASGEYRGVEIEDEDPVFDPGVDGLNGELGEDPEMDAKCLRVRVR